MNDLIVFDPALAGPWPVGRAVYEPGLVSGDWAAAPETKAEPTAIEEMQTLLNDMQRELRAQFAMFQKIRQRAEPGIEGEEAEAKIAKADAKSAVDSLALIARTIEKIDGLQRSLADALNRQAEENFDDAAYQVLLADIERKISERAEERARRLLEERTNSATDGTGPPGTQGQGAVAADTAAHGGEAGMQDRRDGRWICGGNAEQGGPALGCEEPECGDRPAR